MNNSNHESDHLGRDKCQNYDWDKLLKACKIVTFDVFDTILGRDVFVPHDVHIEVGLRHKQHGIPTSIFYKKRRVIAEKQAGSKAMNSPKLSEIYSQLGKLMSWSEQHVAQAMQLETEVEKEVSLRLDHGASLLQCARDAGKFKGFISDMYLPVELITELLKQSGLWMDGDQIWVSCEEGAKKSNGKLFQKLHQELDLAYDSWLHIGDAPKGDNTVPSSLGMMTFPVPNPVRPQRLLKLYPGKLLRRRSITQNSLCGAIERAVRAMPDGLSKEHQTIWKTTCTAVAPTICNFTLWALKKAENLGLEELLCFARDGQTVHRAAEIIQPSINASVKTRYMPASRQAFRLAGIREIGEFELSWVFSTHGPLPPAVVAERLGDGKAIRSAIADLLTSSGYSYEDHLNPKSQKILKEWVLSPEGQSLILESAKQQRDLAVQYVSEQNIAKPFGVLDIGWAGSLQDGLVKMLAETPYKQNVLHGLYLGLNRSKNFKPESVMHGHLFNPSHVPKLYHKATQLLEMFFAADHPQVFGFTNTADGRADVRYLPDTSWQQAMEWGVVVQQNAVLALTHEIIHTKLLDSPENWQADAEMLMCDFLKNPSKIEAQAYRTWIVSSFVGLETNECLGPILNKHNFKSYVKNFSLSSHQWQPIMRAVNKPWIYYKYRVMRSFLCRLASLR